MARSGLDHNGQGGCIAAESLGPQTEGIYIDNLRLSKNPTEPFKEKNERCSASKSQSAFIFFWIHRVFWKKITSWKMRRA